MKKRMLIAVQVCLAAVLGAGWTGDSVAAQMPNKVTVTLPAPVKVGDVTMPAGMLTLQGANLSDDYPVITLRGQNGTALQTLVLRISAPNGAPVWQSKIELRRVDDTYYLDKIWLAGQDSGYQVLPAPRQ